jgi:hypothetical protein
MSNRNIEKVLLRIKQNVKCILYIYEIIKWKHQIRLITKLPNSEQSYKGKVKTHKYINRKKQSTTGKL